MIEAETAAVQAAQRSPGLEVPDHVDEDIVEMLRRCRVEDVADVVVGRDPVHAEEGHAVGVSAALLEHPLVGQEGQGLGEEHREGRHADIGPAVGTARATPPPKQFTPCAGSGPHRREGKLPPRTSSAKMTAGINPECRESRPAGGKDQLPKGYRERQTGRCGMFRSPTGRTTVQSATNPMLHAETPCNSTIASPDTAGAHGSHTTIQPAGNPGSTGLQGCP